MIQLTDDFDDFDDFDDEIEGDLNCPNCGREYDDIDFEYQICHYCNFNNNPPPIKQPPKQIPCTGSNYAIVKKV